MTINLNTMQPEPAEAVAHQAEQAAVVVRTLQLTEQQQEIVCVGMGIYYDMLAVIHHKCQDINNQRTAVLEEPCADGALADAHGDSSGGRASSAWDMQDLAERRDWLEKQEELTNQLDLLLHKEVRAAHHLVQCKRGRPAAYHASCTTVDKARAHTKHMGCRPCTILVELMIYLCWCSAAISYWHFCISRHCVLACVSL
jgi:hypothetical protein